jgi:hypothetical protein
MAVIEAIQTTYLEADGWVEWTSIPDTYEHLQIRASFQDTNATNSATGFTLSGYVNNANGYGYYATHALRGHGTTEVGYASAGWIATGYMQAEPDIPSYAGAVIDILDYANPNKKTTMMSMSGYVGTLNSVGFHSVVWHTTGSLASTGLNGAIDQILINSPGGGGLLRGSSFTLYGWNSS